MSDDHLDGKDSDSFDDMEEGFYDDELYGRFWVEHGVHDDVVRDFALGADTLYSASDDGTLKAFEKDTGKLITTWNEPELGKLRAVEVTEQGYVYAAGSAGLIFRTGKPGAGSDETLLEFGGGRSVNSLAISYFDPGYLYASGRDGTVRAFSANLQEEMWVFDGHEAAGEDGRGVVEVVLDSAGETLFSAGYDDNTIHALDAESGESVWSTTVDGPGSLVDIAVADGTAVAISSGGYVYELDVGTGDIQYGYQALPQAAAVEAVSSEDNHSVFALPSNTHQAWKVDEQDGSYSIYAGDLDGNILRSDFTLAGQDGSYLDDIYSGIEDEAPAEKYIVSSEEGLRNALADADGLAKDNLLIVIREDLELSEGLVYELDYNLLISGWGGAASRKEISAAGGARIFDIAGNPQEVSFERLDLRGGNAQDGAGGAIRAGCTSKLILTDMGFTDNQAATYGGAIQARSIEASQVQFSNNVAFNGGAVHQNGWQGEPVSFSMADFTDNTAASRGGAIMARSADMVFEGSTFEGNQAGISGDIIYGRLAENSVAFDSGSYEHKDPPGMAIDDYSHKVAIEFTELEEQQLEQGTEYEFEFMASGLPADLEEVEYNWLFGDGDSVSGTTEVVDGQASATETHTYSVTNASYSMWVELFDPETGGPLGEGAQGIQVGSPDLRNEYQLNECDNWMVADSGGQGFHVDEWDISALPEGTVFDFKFNAHSIPDRYMIEYAGEQVLDTGWRGSSGHDGDPHYPGGVESPGNGQVDGIFTKRAGEESFEVNIHGPASGTAWDYEVFARCELGEVGAVNLVGADQEYAQAELVA